MFKYLELAVELRKSYIAKEGIFQYKLICQQTNIKSFEDVVRRYIELAEEKAEWAKNRAAARNLDEVDDLDVVQTPEEILLSAVSSEDQQVRSERVKLIPWVRFLWEAYRQCLDILKNNVRTEALYHEIAHRAFQFCIKFNRKTEFRKLCDNLRTHMDYLRKTQLNAQHQPPHAQSHMVNLNNPESLAMQLETRLIQLESATQIELWQEAYRATDDIKRYGLMNSNKKATKPQLMANYYQKLALVFWKADCHLFHAAALFRLFHLTRELKKTITPEEVQRMASKVVLATLTIPIPPNRQDIDKLVDTEENTVETHQRNLASLLGLNTVLPTRTQLVKDLKRMGYLQHAYQPLQDLYRYLEVDFNPLAICERVKGVIEFIEKCDDCADINNYTSALKNIAILRLLKGVSQVYQTIEYNRLSELCPFADSIYLETMVVEAARRNDLQVRIDHRKRSLHFGTELCVSQTEEVTEGPHLQSMPSEQMRLQLVNTYSTLLKARSMIEPESLENRRESIRIDIMCRYVSRRDAEHDAILARSSLIEDRKKQLEILSLRMEQEDRLRQEAKQRKIAEEENQRALQEKETRDRQVKDRESNETAKAAPARPKLDLLGPREDLEQVKKEQKELIQKQRRLERKIDHFERAKRLEEIPLLEKEYEKWREVDRKIWEECENQRIADILAERELAKTLSRRLHKIVDDASSFEEIVNKRHQAIYEEKMASFNSRLASERVERLEALKRKRVEDRRAQFIKEKEKIEEELKREKEEERRRQHAAEDDARRRREREEEDRKRIEEERSSASNWRVPAPDSRPVGLGRGGFGPDSGPMQTMRGGPTRTDDGISPPIRGGPRQEIGVGPPMRGGPPRHPGGPPQVIRGGPDMGLGGRGPPGMNRGDAGPIRGGPGAPVQSRPNPDADSDWRKGNVDMSRRPAPPQVRPNPDADSEWRKPANPEVVRRPGPPPPARVHPDADSDWREGNVDMSRRQAPPAHVRPPPDADSEWRKSNPEPSRRQAPVPHGRPNPDADTEWRKGNPDMARRPGPPRQIRPNPDADQEWRKANPEPARPPQVVVPPPQGRPNPDADADWRKANPEQPRRPVPQQAGRADQGSWR